MDRATKREILFSYVDDLENKHGSVGAAEENGDKQFKEMRAFVKRYFKNDASSVDEVCNVHHRWSETEVDYLKKYFEALETKDVAEALGLSINQVWYKASQLGLKKLNKNDTAYKRMFIIENYNKMSRDEIAKFLGMTYSGVSYYVRVLKKEGLIIETDESGNEMVVGWTEEDIDYLIKHYPTANNKEMAKTLGKTVNALRVKAHSMGIKKRSEVTK